MENNLNYIDFLPQILPHKMSGKITYQICINNHKRNDGTQALYLRLYQDKSQKKLNLNISIPVDCFDAKKQRVKTNHPQHKDYNLLIEKILAEINKIMVEYRLNDVELSLKKLVKGLLNPGMRTNFNLFYEKLLEEQRKKGVIQFSTYKQQLATLNKIKAYQNPVLFSEITDDWLSHWQAHLRTTLKNKPATVAIATKNFKKYIKAANKAGIKTNLNPSDIKVKRHKSNFTFLLPKEVKALYKLYKKDVATDWTAILQRYLFSCFTGLRLSDTKALTVDNFVGDVLIFNAKKTGKLQRIKLNQTALELVELPEVFKGTYTDQHINRELKHIAKAAGIKKRLYYHSSRHTFATNYLVSGGQIRNLQKLLGHSKIETTEIYSHVVDSLMDKEIGRLDDIVN